MKLNNKNVFVLLTFCFLFLVVAFSFQHGFNILSSRDLSTDSGFDSDFGGSDSGWDSGSSSSSSSSYGRHSGSSSGHEVSPVFYIYILVVAVVVVFPVLPVLFNFKRCGIALGLAFGFMIGVMLSITLAILTAIPLYILLYIYQNINYFVLTHLPSIILIPLAILEFIPIIAMLLGIKKYLIKQHELQERKYKEMSLNGTQNNDYFHEVISNPSIVNEAYDIYVKVQEAWSKNDVGSLRSLISDAMYNMYSDQIETMIRRNQRNEMSNFEFVRGCIHDYKSYGDKEVYVITLQVLCKDYLVDVYTNEVIKGDINYINNYIYSLTFERYKGVDIKECPNCKAPLPTSSESVKCSYCGSIINKKSTSMVLIDKKMIQQS